MLSLIYRKFVEIIWNCSQHLGPLYFQWRNIPLFSLRICPIHHTEQSPDWGPKFNQMTGFTPLVFFIRQFLKAFFINTLDLFSFYPFDSRPTERIDGSSAFALRTLFTVRNYPFSNVFTGKKKSNLIWLWFLKI